MKTWKSSAIIVAIVMSSNLNATTIIDTTSAWDGVTSIDSFGEGSTVTYGQTFVVSGSDTTLSSFSFWLDDLLASGHESVEFSSYIMEWTDGVGSQSSHATGDILYKSDLRLTTNNNGLGGMEMVTFQTGGLQLGEGSKYVAFMSAIEYLDGVNGGSSVGTIVGGYGSGDFVHQNSADIGQFTSAGWNVATASNVDLAFQATFTSPVPVPAAIWLFGSGLIGLIGLARRKQ